MKLGVKISSLKSLVSHCGAAEFAKRFRVRAPSDCSFLQFPSEPLWVGSHHPLGVYALMMKYPGLPLHVVLRIAGTGYKVLSRMFGKV